MVMRISKSWKFQSLEIRDPFHVEKKAMASKGWHLNLISAWQKWSFLQWNYLALPTLDLNPDAPWSYVLASWKAKSEVYVMAQRQRAESFCG